jgi:hypothetical protein
MQEQFSSARKILEAFKEGKTFLCLSDLAKASGFPRASDKDFKLGFNYLVSKGVLKLQQSGWRSEQRGSKSHSKAVILTADIYEVRDSEFEVDTEKLVELPQEVVKGMQKEFSLNTLSENMIGRLRGCVDCLHNPILFITQEKIPVCSKHWNSIANSDMEW